MNILELVSKNKAIQSWFSGTRSLGRQLVMGLSGSSKALAIAANFIDQPEKIVIVTASQNESEKLSSDLAALLGEENIFQFFLMTLLQLNLFFLLWIELFQELKQSIS